MDKNIIKIIGLLVGLIVLVAVVVLVAINGINVGPLKVVSISDIGDRKQDVEEARGLLQMAEEQYGLNVKKLENAKEDFNAQKEAYELISDETIAAIREATKEEEYFIEYLWITLGNYAASHNLSLAIIEPGGSVSNEPTTTPTTQTDETTVSTGTGVTGNSQGVNSTTNAATTGSPTSGTQQGGTDTTVQEQPITSGLTSSSNALTVQVKGSYIDLADFVFEVENDKSLRFRLDNIKMKSAGGTQVITSFNVKDFTVLKSLE